MSPAWAVGAGVVLMAMSSLRPPQVTTVFPADGAVVTQVAAVGAELDLGQGERVDPASLRLLVDGADVTARATITMTRDWPPSFVSISYAPGALGPGVHGAELSLQKEAGGAVRYAWRFTIRLP